MCSIEFHIYYNELIENFQPVGRTVTSNDSICKLYIEIYVPMNAIY